MLFFFKAFRTYISKTRELVLRCRAHILRIILEYLLLLPNGLIQLLRLQSHGLKASFHMLRALSRVVIRAVIVPQSGIIKQYTNTIPLITYLPDGTLYVIPDLESIGLLWHVRDIRDYELLTKPKLGSLIIDVGAHVGLSVINVYKRLKAIAS